MSNEQSNEVPRAVAAEPGVTEEVVDALGKKILVRNRTYFLQDEIPSVLPSFGYYVPEFELIPKGALVPHIQMLQREGIALSLFPGGKETYDFFCSSGVEMGHAESKWAVVPSSMVQHSPIRNPEIFFVGEAHRCAPGPAVLLLTISEASLKSKYHAAHMNNALKARLQEIVPPMFLVSRCGDNFIEIKLLKWAFEKMAKEESSAAAPMVAEGTPNKYLSLLNLKEIALLPGVAILYDPMVRDEPDPTLPRDIRAMRKAKEAGLRKFGRVLADGAGGLPVIRSQRVLCLLSGGLDSPVAAYRMMVRGCSVDCIHFLNSTSDTAKILQKLQLICTRLSRLEGRTELLIADIGSLQAAIIAAAGISDRTLLYKLFMLLISSAVTDYLMLVTGDSVGQVASQTPQNISELYPMVPRAVVAPLAGSNKKDIVLESQKLGLYESSILEGADCCQYLSCVRGANIGISHGRLRDYIRSIQVPDIRVTVHLFRNGEEEQRNARSFVVPASHIVARNFAHIAVAEPSKGIASPAEMDPQPKEEFEDLYFDAASATLEDVSVRQAMFDAPQSNPNSIHTMGRAARAAVEKVRFEVLQFMCGASARGMHCIFTSGGTESNNLGIRGLARMPGVTSVFYSSIAHPSLVKVSQNSGVKDVVPIVVHVDGTINVEWLRDALQKATAGGGRGIRALVCVDLVNNEIGVVQPMDEIVSVVRQFNCLLHVDACQALCKISFDASAFDSTAVSAHKINGPQGVGALLVKSQHTSHMSPVIFGSGSEVLRPGTENVPGIVGFGAALAIDRNCTGRASVNDVHKYLLQRLASELPVRINGNTEHNSKHVIHTTVNRQLLPPKLRSLGEEDIISAMASQHRVMISSGAACLQLKSALTEEKELYKALGVPHIGPTIRISYDHNVTIWQCDRLMQALKSVLGGSK